VANLTREADRRRIAASSSHPVITAGASAEGDAPEMEGYWDMPGGDDKIHDDDVDVHDNITTNDRIVVAPHVRDPTHPRHAYWDWDASPRATSADANRLALIDHILEEEAARQLTGSDHVVRSILRARRASQGRDDDATDEAVRAPHADDPDHFARDYWAWPTPVGDKAPRASEEERRRRRDLIDRILRDEAARQATAADAVVEGLLRSRRAAQRAQDERPVVVVEESKESAGGYWDW